MNTDMASGLAYLAALFGSVSLSEAEFCADLSTHQERPVNSLLCQGWGFSEVTPYLGFLNQSLPVKGKSPSYFSEETRFIPTLSS